MVALDFDNPSAEALYNKIAQALGIVVDNTVQEFTNSENRILATITNKNYGKSGYYTDKAKAFQFGDNLAIDPVTKDFYYPVINVQNQIISQAALEEIVTGSNAQLFLKVATLNNVTGDLQQLTNPQLAAFSSYYSNFEILDIPVAIISLPPNILNFSAACNFFKTYDLSKLQTNLAAALTTFRQTFPFNGEFYTGDLQDYVKQNVPGVRDFFASNTILDATTFAGSSTLLAGYFNYNANILTGITYTAVAA
jgi:hypothetical protein